jgi:hypothetical protein
MTAKKRHRAEGTVEDLGGFLNVRCGYCVGLLSVILTAGHLGIGCEIALIQCRHAIPL